MQLYWYRGLVIGAFALFCGFRPGRVDEAEFKPFLGSDYQLQRRLSADLDGDGKTEVVLQLVPKVSSEKSAAIVILDRAAKGFKTRWRWEAPQGYRDFGSFSSFAPTPAGIRNYAVALEDVNGDKQPDIVAGVAFYQGSDALFQLHCWTFKHGEVRKLLRPPVGYHGYGAVLVGDFLRRRTGNEVLSADFIWEGEGHPDPHRYTVTLYGIHGKAGTYEELLKFNTRKKYAEPNILLAKVRLRLSRGMRARGAF
jgi:hypothetical protein